MTDPVFLTIVSLTFLLAGLVKGVIGLGLPTVAIGLLSLVMAPAQAAALLIVPSLITNVWQCTGKGLWPLLRRLWPMLLGIGVGTYAGGGLLTADDGGRATLALGMALILYAVVGLSAARFSVPPAAEPWLSPLVGVATGLVTAATGVFVIPAVPYLQALALDKDDLVQALGISFLVSTLALTAVLASTAALTGPLAATSLLALAPALLGMGLGQWIRSRVRAETFRRCFFVGLLLVGGHLAVRGLL